MINVMKYLFLLILICFFILICCYVFFDFYENIGFHDIKVLLQQTDYQELLKAGRELISKAEWEEYVTADRKRGRRLIIPKDIKKPEIILKLEQKLSDLNMHEMFISGSLLILFSYPHESISFGVVILQENDNSIPGKDQIELIPGLWYYDELYNESDPGYKKKIEKMIKKNKYLNKNKLVEVER